MVKKIIRLVFYIGEIIFCFLEVFNVTEHANGSIYQQSGILFDEATCTYGFDPPFEKPLDIFIWIFIVSLFINFVLVLFEIIKPQKSLSKKYEIIINSLPVLSFIILSLIAFLPHSYETEYGYYVSFYYEINVLYIIFTIIILLNFIFQFIPEINIPNTQKVNEQTNIQSLEQYKGLLEKGIISQEEFDAKKKQILGL